MRVRGKQNGNGSRSPSESKYKERNHWKKNKDYKITVLTLSFFPTSNLPFYHPSLTLLFCSHKSPTSCSWHLLRNSLRRSQIQSLSSFFLLVPTYIHACISRICCLRIRGIQMDKKKKKNYWVSVIWVFIDNIFVLLVLLLMGRDSKI